MSAEAYTKVVHYHFEVAGEMMSIADVGDDFVCVEEVAKNGQEDSHMVGVLEQSDDGLFAWSEGESMFVLYGSKELADGIRKHLNTHGVPKPTISRASDHLARELACLIDRFRMEYQITYSEAVGVLELVKSDLIEEARKSA
jgi:hypothetical protein